MPTSAGDFLAERGAADPRGDNAAWLQGARFYRQAHHEAASALLDAPQREKRDLLASESRAFERHVSEVKEFDNLIGAAEKAERSMNESRSTINRFRDSTGGSNSAGTGAPGSEVRSFIRGEVGHLDVAFETRALSKLTAGAGANTVPTSFSNLLTEHLINTARIIGVANVLNTAGGETLQIPTTTAKSTGTLTAEAAVIAASDPAFGQASLGSFKYATLFQVSNELLEDTGVDLEGYLARQAGEALGNAFGAHLATGTGTAQPRGITVDATTGVTGGTGVAGAFTADNLIDLYFSVIAPYRANGTWLMSDTALAAVRKLKDTTNQYLFQPSLIAGTPDTLLGRPVVTDFNIAAPSIGAKSVLFGDLSRYTVRIVGGVRVEKSSDFAFSSDLATFRAILRGDGRLTDLQGSVKAFVGGAT